MWNNILVTMILLCNTIYDLRYKKVSLVFLEISGVFGVIMWIFKRQISWQELLLGVLIGILFLLIAKLTNQIGEGDGIILIVLGIYLGVWQLTAVLLMSLFLTAIFSIILLVAFKKNRKYTIPFVPFIFVSYLIQLFLTKA